MLTWLAAFPLSLLPADWRRRWIDSTDPGMRSGARRSGLVQCLVFFLWANRPLDGRIQTVLLYFSAEGLARFAAAFATEEILPTLPLWLIAKLLSHHEAKKAEAALPPLVPDLLEHISQEDCTLRIATCRPRHNWNTSITLRIEGELYEIAREDAGDAARPFVYVLRPAPEHKVVRGLHEYSTTELLSRS